MVDLQRASLDSRRLSYDAVGASQPQTPGWPTTPSGFRRLEATRRVRCADGAWTEVTELLLSWAVKTRSGFAVDGSRDAARIAHVGERHWVSAALGPVVVSEPVEVVAMVETPDRVGFAYGTLLGHPVSGEEAFIVHRDEAGRVWLTLRSLTRAAPSGPWRLAFPALLVAQRVYRRRYARALDRG
jgi:uncharacterized protein (UPF0548 family)